MKQKDFNKLAAIKKMIAAAEEESFNGLPFKNYYPNTELCVDLKFFTHTPGRLLKGMYIPGYIMCDKEGHYTIIEAKGITTNAAKRNKNVFNGDHITITRRKADGKPRLNFKAIEITAGFNVEAYAFAVANEIIDGLRKNIK